MGDGGEFALSDLVPFVSVGGKRLRPRGADNSQGESKDVRLRQVTVVLQRKSDQKRRNSKTSVKLRLLKSRGSF